MTQVTPATRNVESVPPSGTARNDSVLPQAVRDLAERLGATDDASLTRVTLEQTGTMRPQPKGRAMRFSAYQTIDLRHLAFEWRAKSGPFGCISVVDAYDEGVGRLDVHLLRRVRLAHASGAAVNKGELMRYLAELAWAPDAILGNRSLVWRVADKRTLLVSAGHEQASGEVELKLDDTGQIASIWAQDRPYSDGKIIVDRPWFGRFSDYRQRLGRWLPFAGEVGWVLDGKPSIYWRGNISSWSID